MPICTVSGSVNISLDKLRISSGIVAEKNSVWRCSGTYFRMRRISGKKPMSHIWSASSSTSTSRLRKLTWPSPMRSSKRPGQATKISVPRLSAAICGPLPTPPYAVILRMRVNLPNCTADSWICSASSRVGARISARVWRNLPVVNLLRIGNKNAAVLPVPVCAKPSTSRSSSTIGIACAWIGVGVSYPAARMPRMTRSSNENESKDISYRVARLRCNGVTQPKTT